MTLTDADALALRRPFPPESVGKLPKSTCRDCSQSPRKRCDRHQWVSNCPECHGNHTSATLHLDYVGHAAVTDRLLTVDREWTWEPFALGPEGLPAADRQGNLWIRLTVCGISRIGVGDGASVKEVIGDAIRNAAMRFGVGLDLWAKENLVEFAQHAGAVAPQTSPAPGVPAAPAEPSAPPAESAADEGDVYGQASAGESPLLNISSSLAKAMYAGIRGSGLADDDRLPFISAEIGREIGSTKEMTEDEARKVLDALKKFAPEGDDQ